MTVAPYRPGPGWREHLADERMPVPWILGDPDRPGFEWTVFDGARSSEAKWNLTDQPCQVCGHPTARGVRIILAAFDAVDTRESSGPAVHPGCALLALDRCPHFTTPRHVDRMARRPAVVGWAWIGPDRGWRFGDEHRTPWEDVLAFEGATTVTPAACPVTRDQIEQLVEKIGLKG